MIEGREERFFDHPCKGAFDYFYYPLIGNDGTQSSAVSSDDEFEDGSEYGLDPADFESEEEYLEALEEAEEATEEEIEEEIEEEDEEM